MNIGNSLRVIDLFSGAGGLSLGFYRAGFDVVLAVDRNKDAVKTHNLNLPCHAEVADVSSYLNRSDLQADVIVGGPPCQGFSSAGLRKHGDTRNSLVSVFAELIIRNKPKAFVFENVEGFLTAENGDRLFELLEPLVQAGYRIHLRKINAANFGVPQHRKRVIAIGGLGWDPSFPIFTHYAFGAPGAGLAGQGLVPTPTVEEALNGLGSASIDRPGTPDGHYYRPLVGLDLERAMALAPGATMRDLPMDLQHSSYQRRANRRVMDGTPTERRGGAPTGIRRLRPDEPSKAITGGAMSEFLHPTENRSLTIRECARIQTFPDDFVFCGNQSSQMQQIGNAVPPLLAQAIASTLFMDLIHHQDYRIKQGKLISFLPTLSTGFSPILRQITNKVAETFYVRESDIQEGYLWD